LEDFKEIMADELPMWLPPLCDISHQIDLIPRSSLTNKVPHRMNLLESEEVNWQVQELLD